MSKNINGELVCCFTSVNDELLLLYLIYNRLCRNTHQTNR